MLACKAGMYIKQSKLQLMELETDMYMLLMLNDRHCDNSCFMSHMKIIFPLAK